MSVMVMHQASKFTMISQAFIIAGITKAGRSKTNQQNQSKAPDDLYNK